MSGRGFGEEGEVARRLADLISNIGRHDNANAGLSGLRNVRTFEDVGMLTMNAGIVLYFDDGGEYALTLTTRNHTRLVEDEYDDEEE